MELPVKEFIQFSIPTCLDLVCSRCILLCKYTYFPDLLCNLQVICMGIVVALLAYICSQIILKMSAIINNIP